MIKLSNDLVASISVEILNHIFQECCLFEQVEDEYIDQSNLIILSATGHSVEREYLLRGFQNNTPVIQFIDTYHGYRERLTVEGLFKTPTELWVLDNIAKQDAINAGINTGIIKISGQPDFELILKKFRNNWMISPKKGVLFCDQLVEKHYGIKLGYTEKTSWDLLVKARTEHLELQSQLYLGLHPTRKINTYPSEDKYIIASDIEKVFQNVNVVIGMFSTLLIKAFLIGKQVITLQPGSSEIDLCPLSRNGYISRVRQKIDFHNAVKNHKTCPVEYADNFMDSTSLVIKNIKRLINA
jgi:hypothetical protein